MAIDATERVISAVRRQYPAIENPTIGDIRSPFLAGELYSVNFDFKQTDGTYNKLMFRVYVHGNKEEIYVNDDVLLTVLGRTHRREPAETLVSPEGVSAIIALILTITLVFLIATKGDNYMPPDIIANALTVILGFYFGTAVKRKSD